jgi:hypothetical protein
VRKSDLGQCVDVREARLEIFVFEELVG